MGKIDRLKRITMARIEAFLDSLEKPELILPQLLNEMEQQMRDAAAAKAKALSAVKGARRRLDEATGRSLRLERGAALAVRAGDLKTARQALAAQLEAEQQYQRHQTELENVEKAYLAAEAVFKQISENRDALKKKNTQPQAASPTAGRQILCDQYAIRHRTQTEHHGRRDPHRDQIDSSRLILRRNDWRILAPALKNTSNPEHKARVGRPSRENSRPKTNLTQNTSRAIDRPSHCRTNKPNRGY